MRLQKCYTLIFENALECFIHYSLNSFCFQSIESAGVFKNPLDILRNLKHAQFKIANSNKQSESDTVSVKTFPRYDDNSTRRISDLLSEYLNNGIEYFLEEHRKGGNRRNLTDEQEMNILAKFKEKAESGQVIKLYHFQKNMQKYVFSS